MRKNIKSLASTQHPDRNEQFEHINSEIATAETLCQPAISINTKNKIYIGNFANPVRIYCPKNIPIRAMDHDFPLQAQKEIPFGIYDISLNKGFINLGLDHDTPKFAVASIRRWWLNMGIIDYPDAEYLLITPDAGGSNSYRSRAFKHELQIFALEIGKPIKVCHYPPGTSKYNRIEHRLFSFISKHWGGIPLTDLATIKNLINTTTTETGLIVK
jgi:hypothetical protein